MHIIWKVNSMRVVLKPMGAAFVLCTLVALTGLAFVNLHGASSSGSIAGSLTAALPAAGPSASQPSGIPVGVSPAETKVALLPTALDGWQLDAVPPSQATRELIADPSVPNMEKRIVRAHIQTIDPQAYYAIQFKHSVDKAIPKNTPLALRFMARSPGHNRIHAVFLLNSQDYPKDLNTAIDLTSSWKVYTLQFITKRDYKPGDAAVLLHLGDAVGEVDLAALQVYPADRLPQ